MTLKILLLPVSHLVLKLCAGPWSLAQVSQESLIRRKGTDNEKVVAQLVAFKEFWFKEGSLREVLWIQRSRTLTYLNSRDQQGNYEEG